jgi:dTDP-4-amino-4,6-dideoxygalactose transaminase
MDQKIVDEVRKVLLSGWITTGPKAKEFEQKLTDYVGCRKTICLSSATAGLELVARWYGLKEGDEVIVPAYTYCASANIVLHCGAKVVLADCDEKDFNISLNEIERHISPRTKIIIPVDISGWPCDYDEINALVKREDIQKVFIPETKEQEMLGRILILSDAAHSIGAYYKGKRTGSLTDISVFSFHAVKNLTTSEGGAVCFNLPEQFDCEQIYKEFNIRSLHGQSKDALAKTQIGNWRYDVLEPGYKCNMMDIQAVIGLVELERYQSNLDKRKEIFDFYNRGFENNDKLITPISSSDIKTTSYHLYFIRIRNASESQRDEIIQKIFEKGISVNVHFQPLPLFTAYKERGFEMADYPVAFSKYENVITLPVYFSLTEADLSNVVNAVNESIKEVIG